MRIEKLELKPERKEVGLSTFDFLLIFSTQQDFELITT